MMVNTIFNFLKIWMKHDTRKIHLRQYELPAQIKFKNDCINDASIKQLIQKIPISSPEITDKVFFYIADHLTVDAQQWYYLGCYFNLCTFSSYALNYDNKCKNWPIRRNSIRGWRYAVESSVPTLVTLYKILHEDHDNC